MQEKVSYHVASPVIAYAALRALDEFSHSHQEHMKYTDNPIGEHF